MHNDRFGVPTLEQFVNSRFADEDEEVPPGRMTTSIRIDVQVLAELEELAAQLDLSRSELTRQLVTIGITDLREYLDRLYGQGQQGQKGSSPVQQGTPVKKASKGAKRGAG